ncbi:Cubilin [Eumeta japonica]|uniref:Cubilin n=1 Tax=Eumeta variegata TaxID=151549 RepID=A0A4C1SZC8_EUMVA|nr:Cubilin [Eumeta japonica]
MVRASVVWFILTICLSMCELRDDRPVLATKNGDLVLRPAFEKNIHLHTNGPGSTILLAGIDVRATLANVSVAPITSDSSAIIITEIRDRLNNLESVLHNAVAPVPSNSTYVLRRLNMLYSKILRLQNRMNKLSRDECSSRPCRNGGTCLLLPGSHHCLCPTKWEGEECDVDVNECRNFAGTDLGCQNGATCINKRGSYECMCKPGWYGLHCTRKAKDCSGGNFEMCGHGICLQVTSGEGVHCICNQGWTSNGTSPACSTDIDECAPGGGAHCSVNPFVQCFNVPGSFRCGACPSGYEGDGYVCTDVNECDTQNGGCSISPMVPCYNTLGSRVCGPCPPATCEDEGGFPRCICPIGAEGNGIGLHGCYVPTFNSTHSCETESCGRRGRCHNLHNGFTCFCDTGFGGIQCETRLDPCASLPCLHGGSCHPDESLPRGFRCECTAYYTGDNCQSRERSCGGVIDAMEGNLAYPLSNATIYGHNVRCAWVIHTAPDKVINVTFSRFNVELSNDCTSDFLQIHDGRSSASQLIGRFCGTELPKGGNIISSHNNLYFWFRSDASQALQGFALHWTSVAPVCGGQINERVYGIIASPGSPGKYPPNRDCNWEISVDFGKRIQINFFLLDLENHSNCSFDYLEIFDGNSRTDPLLGRYCNASLPQPVLSAGSNILIHFHSDAFTSGGGFQISFAATEGMPGCGGRFTAESGDSGVITSPGYPKTYPLNRNCEYIIHVAIGKAIQLTFVDFDLEGGYRTCWNDFVEIHDGLDANSTSLGKFCGGSQPPVQTSSLNYMYLKFVSDFSVTGTGFYANYTSIDIRCGGIYKDPTALINHPPSSSDQYENDQECTWIIIAPLDRHIKLTWNRFDIEGMSSCYSDYVKLIEIDENNEENDLGKYCGRNAPPEINTFTNRLKIKFRSDFSITGTGFSLSYTFLDASTHCGRVYVSSHGYIRSPGWPNNYDHNRDCTWTITLPVGQQVLLNISTFNLEAPVRRKCDFGDYLEIRNGPSETSPLVGRYCGTTIPKRIISFGNSLFLHFHSDYNIGGNGFNIEWDGSISGCGGMLTGSSGSISSPNYPQPYGRNANCRYSVVVNPGSRVKFSFSDLDLENTINCRDDYVQIFDGRDEKYPSLGRFCVMSAKAFDIETTSNFAFIKFRSDFAVGGKGFVLNYETVCTNNITGTHGVIESPNFPNDYPSGFRLEWIANSCGEVFEKDYGYFTVKPGSISTVEPVDCLWKIETSPGTAIQLSIYNAFMRDTPNCTLDAIEVYDGPDTTSHLLTKMCHQSLSAVTSSSSVMFVRLVKQSNLRDVSFNADYHTVTNKCGGRFSGRSGTFTSLHYPKNYDNDLDCLWTLEVPMNHIVELSFVDFDLYNLPNFRDDSSCGDYIRVYDSYYIIEQNYTYQICPNSNITHVFSKSNVLSVQFVSDNYGAAKGFKANFNMTCGGTITVQNDGLLSNDDMPTHFNGNCSWTIVAKQLDQKISLTITHLSLLGNNSIETNRHCPSSFLRVRDGNDESASLINEFCGHKVPPMIVSRGNTITVELGSYSGPIVGKFSAHYSALSTACGGSLTSEEGSIASPNYPDSYPTTSSCEWIVSTSPGNKIYITFEFFSIEYSENCNEDYLEIREDDNAGRLIGVFCGDDRPLNTTVASQLFIKFRSDGEGTGRGFIAHYGFIHGNDISGIELGEIASPLYPKSYAGLADYWWRINTDTNTQISLSVDLIEIAVSGTVCYNYLSIYDGYDDTASLLKEFCGLLNRDTISLKSSNNVVYIKLKLDETNLGSKFHINWNKILENDEVIRDKGVNCGFNRTIHLSPGNVTEIKSPNFPNDYDNDLNCEWIFKTDPGNHVTIKFQIFNLEETSSCFADHVDIYSSKTGGADWEVVRESICLSNIINTYINSTTFMKIRFKTDSSVKRNGFSALVRSDCGGFITDVSGIVNSSWLIWSTAINSLVHCEWAVKARPGRTLNVRILDFNITNGNNDCQNHLTLRNGESIESPLLGQGKFCGYSHEDRVSTLKSSSNALYIVYHLVRSQYQAFSLHYEEQGVECGLTSELDSNNPWEVINSPNYPSIPTPFSECEWKFSAPPGEILKIDFIDRFDLARKEDCDDEFVEIRDGASKISPLKGLFCREKPSTVKTSGNYVYIKYVTQLAEPRNGFRANISIDVCGGTIRADKGEITSPGYPHLISLPYGTVCEWRIICDRTIMITPQDIDLPVPENRYSIKVTIEENIPFNQSTFIIKTFYFDDNGMSLDPIETMSKEVLVKFYFGKPTRYSLMSSVKGFRFTFNASRIACGGRIYASEGFVTTPGYPREVSFPYCNWYIELPNPSRRIRLEILDSNFMERYHEFELYNDVSHQSLIQLFTNGNWSTSTNVFESSSNKLTVFLLAVERGGKIAGSRFKARFTSSEPALCGGTFSSITGQLISPQTVTSYLCEWHIAIGNHIGEMTRTTVNFDSNNLKSVNLNIKFNTSESSSNSYCKYRAPKISITASVGDGTKFTRNVCNSLEVAYTVPASVFDVIAYKGSDKIASFYVDWKMQPCGGTVEVGQIPMDILMLPNNTNNVEGSLDCGWVVKSSQSGRIELKLEGSFQGSCDEEYLEISRLNKLSVVSRYCKDQMISDVKVLLGYIYIQYHARNYMNNTNLKLLASTTNKPCGGVLGNYEFVFASPNYPNGYGSNQECIWDIIVAKGNRIMLNFIGRFAIEDTTNCTKDAVVIYDWRNNKYVQLDRLCGRTLPGTYNSTFNQMRVIFRTDATNNLDGFQAQWSSICGGEYEVTETETILYSPGYPFGYKPFLDCKYKLKATSNRIIIKFLDFSLEGPSPICNYDNLTLSGTISRYYGSDEFIFCGTDIPKPRIFSDDVTLHFKTDIYVSQRGFKISYSIPTCNKNITEPTLITSGNIGDDDYEDDLNCTWIIRAPVDKRIVVKFIFVDLEDNYECYNDYIAVFEGVTINIEKRLALLCGHLNTTTVVRSTGRDMVVEFVTDSSLGYKGFKADISFSYNCGGQVNLTGLSSKSLQSPLYNHEVVYSEFLDCHWIVSAPEGKVIEMEFTNFHIASCRNVNQTALGISKCDCDFVEIRDGHNPNSLVIGTYCGHNRPPTLSSSRNLVGIRLSTDGEIGSSGFTINFSTRDSPCGRSHYEVTGSSQIIKSPGYDGGAIPRGLYCSYYLSQQDDIFIHLRISNMDLQNGSLFNVCDKESEKSHRGVEMEISSISGCSRNYTEPQGRIQVTETESNSEKCSILISVPENITISLYFMYVFIPWEVTMTLQIFDGDTATATLLTTISESDSDIAVFSTGSNVLIRKNGTQAGSGISFDMNYYTSDKGRGCGGRLHNVVGYVASPLYPETYRTVGTCEWELETPAASRLKLKFLVFDLGASCEQNYVQLVDRGGNVFSTYCAETPAIYTSSDNYVKIVFTTTMNNAGSGWTAQFLGVTL